MAEAASGEKYLTLNVCGSGNILSRPSASKQRSRLLLRLHHSLMSGFLNTTRCYLTDLEHLSVTLKIVKKKPPLL
jgi:hypothetical protein